MTRTEALEVYRIQHEKFRHNQHIQWTFNIAIWTLIALAIQFFKPPNDGVPAYLLLWLSTIFFVTHLLFVWRIQRVHEVTKNIWLSILGDLNRQSDDNIVVDIKRLTVETIIPPTGFYWMFFQMAATGVLLAVLNIVHLGCQPPNF